MAVKFNLHCHTREGSPDARIGVVEFARMLKERGFDGMLVTDHSSYGGYLAYQNSENKVNDFVVLRGIEYDTFEYGHILVVMPSDTDEDVFRLLETRGLKLGQLIRIVHGYGGILGPSHPYGTAFQSFCHARPWDKLEHDEYMQQFDFVEAYNACESEANNDRAVRLAEKYGLPTTGGSDAHRPDCCVWSGYKMLPETITTEDDFIAYFKRLKGKTKSDLIWGGKRYFGTLKYKLGPLSIFVTLAYYPYNKILAWLATPRRKMIMNQLASKNGSIQ